MLIKHPMHIHLGEVEMINPLTNQNYIACISAVGVFITTADDQHIQNTINNGLQAVLESEANYHFKPIQVGN